MKEAVGDVAPKSSLTVRTALRFVVLLGVVSLFADTTYEGARSIVGPYLYVLGASAAVVGFVAGFGELIGYSIRLLSGYLTDRVRNYWGITFTGYAINLFAVPFLALAGSWQVAIVLVVAERAGKGLRTPARDVMLSHATSQVGHGWGFGLHEAMDQIGAIMGPLIVAGVLFLRTRDYALAFAVLAIPAVLSFGSLAAGRWLYPRPHELEAKPQATLDRGQRNFPRVYWIYLAGVACVGIGYADFALLAYHFAYTGRVPDVQIPILFAAAMGIDGLAALVMGRLFDRRGLWVLVPVSLLTAAIAPLGFSLSYPLLVVGTLLWGVGMGAQESIMRSAVALMIPIGRRGSGYGVFNMIYGICWFLGSVALGVLYGISLPLLMAFSMTFELASLPFLYFAAREVRHPMVA